MPFINFNSYQVRPYEIDRWDLPDASSDTPADRTVIPWCPSSRCSAVRLRRRFIVQTKSAFLAWCPLWKDNDVPH